MAYRRARDLREGVRVRITDEGGMPEFHERTGTIDGVEWDGPTRMYRVVLDEPVQVNGNVVRDDLWAAELLSLLTAQEEFELDGEGD